jgi:hypothetical protein
LHTFAAAGRTITLVNALAANDPESTAVLWQRYAAGAAAPVTVLLNCRPDRKYRTAQLAQMLAAVHRGPFLVTGDGAFGRRQLTACGVPAAAVRTIAGTPALDDLFAACPAAGDQAIIFAAGNVQGLDRLPIWRQAGATAPCTYSS